MATDDKTTIHHITPADHPKAKEVHFANPPPRRPTVATAPQRRRLGVDNQGQYTYKKTPSSILVASLQLGLQHSIGGIEPKPRRDILMTDFEVVETAGFPAAGSDITPAHKYKDFTFKTYSPEAFRFFREAFGIAAEDYLLAMCDQPLREVSNPGASGSLFYLSADDAFIIKTVQKKEARFLQKLLPGYYLNLTQNKRTLLPKFFGLYRYKSGSVNIRIVVMNNLLPTSIRYHEKYDLKGSTYKRRAGQHEMTKKSPTFKDLDFVEKHAEGVLLAPEKYDALLKTVDRDCKVLQSFGIMDYSLLVGIHNMNLVIREKTGASVDPNDDSDVVMGLPLRSRIELSKNFSIVSTENIPLAAQTEAAEPMNYPEGYIQGRLKEDTVLIYMGVIDILQSYRLKKKLEHTMKAVITDGSTVSVHNPTFYARRFQDFMTQQVFKRDKVKGRPRKNSSAAQGRGHRQGGPSRRGGGAGGGARREARLSPLHESTTVGGQQKISGVRPITRGRSASEYIPRSKGKDHLPEIPAMNIKPSEERASSLSGKGSSITTSTSPPAVSITITTTTTEQRSPSRDKRDQSVTDGPVASGTGTEEALEASVDFARNIRGTSTPIDVSPDMGNNRSQTFNGAVDVTNASDANDRKPPTTTNTAPETVDMADSIDTQQIELSLVDNSEEHSRSHSKGGTEAVKVPLSPEAQSGI